MNASESAIQAAVSAMTAVLKNIVSGRDCDYLDAESRPNPCDCPSCAARDVLAVTSEWRYVGASHDRVTTTAVHNPRETALHASWKRHVDDRKLGAILDSRPEDPRVQRALIIPSGRDWYVATSVVQWLATNVGRGVLEEAGFRYQHDDKDYRQRRAREPDMAERVRNAEFQAAGASHDLMQAALALRPEVSNADVAYNTLLDAARKYTESQKRYEELARDAKEVAATK